LPNTQESNAPARQSTIGRAFQLERDINEFVIKAVNETPTYQNFNPPKSVSPRAAMDTRYKQALRDDDEKIAAEFHKRFDKRYTNIGSTLRACNKTPLKTRKHLKVDDAAVSRRPVSSPAQSEEQIRTTAAN
jgi:hypothetical protein